MKIFSWVQNKLNRRLVFSSQKENLAVSSPPHNPNYKQLQEKNKEELIDWPHDGLLTIGTIGNHHIIPPFPHHQENIITSTDDQDQEKVGGGGGELGSGDDDTANIDAVKHGRSFLRSPSSLLLSRGNNNDKDISSSSDKNTIIGKKSFSFLLKKMFACSNGFAPPVPNFIDPLPESRMEKILRAILHKKIYPQSCTTAATATATMSTKRYLENKQVLSCAHLDYDTDDDGGIAQNIGSKWVRTDSEYIVLEI